MSDMVKLSELQAESARTNEANSVIAFLLGVVDRIHRAKTIEEAKTVAEDALATIEEWHAGIWKPGPHSDPADWGRP